MSKRHLSLARSLPLSLSHIRSRSRSRSLALESFSFGRFLQRVQLTDCSACAPKSPIESISFPSAALPTKRAYEPTRPVKPAKNHPFSTTYASLRFHVRSKLAVLLMLFPMLLLLLLLLWLLLLLPLLLPRLLARLHLIEFDPLAKFREAAEQQQQAVAGALTACCCMFLTRFSNTVYARVEPASAAEAEALCRCVRQRVASSGAQQQPDVAAR